MDPEVQRKLLELETYVNEVLKQDLAELARKLDAKNTDVAEFLQLKSVIMMFQTTNIAETGFKTQLDIGNSFFIQACVTDASKILLDVGLGHYVEFTLDEAVVVLNVRIKLFERQIAELRKAIAKTNAHIKLMLLGIRQIQGFKDCS
jgi:prefoldin alpha subunit